MGAGAVVGVEAVPEVGAVIESVVGAGVGAGWVVGVVAVAGVRDVV